MYSCDKWFCFFLLLLVVTLSYSFSIVISDALIQNLGTLFSILFGFYIAALSVLYGSAYAKKLYSKIDGAINTQTQLHTLRRYFSASSTWAILSLIMIILTSLLSSNSTDGVLTPRLPIWSLGVVKGVEVTFDFGLFWNSAVLGATSVNLYLALRLLKVLLAGFVAEAKNKE